MRPEFYADLYRRFASFCRDYSGNELIRVGCGPSGHDRNWSRVVMQRAGDAMQGYSLHYYTQPAPWDSKLRGTRFDEEQWIVILKECLKMREAIEIAAPEMDVVDPDQRVRLIVDEWGTWYRTEPDYPGSSLYQQNTLRDALVAGLTLHIFQELNDRVHMANIPQLVNVLQSMILTSGEKMLLTPSYHVFAMYKVHQDAKRLPVELTSPEYAYGEKSMPALSISASRNETGVVHVSIVNADPHNSTQLKCELPGVKATKVTGRILTSAQLDAHNTFEAPDRVKPLEFDQASVENEMLEVNVPPKAILVLTLNGHP